MIIVVIVAIVVVVGGLFAAGVIKLSSSGGGSSGTQYTVTFTEAGLPSGTSWSVTLSGATQSSTSSTISVNEANGTYSFTVGSVSGYTASPSSGLVTVSGAAVSEAITFTPSAATTYTVTFTEAGLLPGVSWSVTLNGATGSSSTSTIAFAGMANGTYSFGVEAIAGYTATPSSGLVTVNGATVSEAITFASSSATTYAVIFSETGLASGATWSVTFDGVLMSGMGPIQFPGIPNGTYAFSASAAGYTASPASGTIAVNGSDVSEPIAFTPTTVTTYTVTFMEAGLPPGTLWSVTLNGVPGSSSTSSIGFAESNGTYSFSVAVVSGYAATPASGSLAVTGAALTEAITFTASSPSGQYPVTFSQTGLPSNLLWEVLLYSGNLASRSNLVLFGEGAEGASFELAVPNGAYVWIVESSYANYTASPSSGNLTVSGGPVTIAVQFVPIVPTSTTYPLTFTETGLPNGAAWQVILVATLGTGVAGGTISFSEPNGTYYYNDVSTTTPGYQATQDSGDVIINGHAVTVAIVFQQVYTVTFEESGLASGASWETILNGTGGFGYVPYTAWINFTLPDGTYSFTVSASGYTASPASGTVTISGAAVTKLIMFTPTTPPQLYPITFTETGLPVGSYWSVEVISNDQSGYYGNSSNTSTVIVPVPDGYYTWEVFGVLVAGYVATPAAGGAIVNGAGPSESVTFLYAPADRLVIVETLGYLVGSGQGLPNGTSWSVTLNGTVQSTTGLLLAFYVPNGTYTFTVSSPSGYTAIPGSGSFTVNSDSSPGFATSAYVYAAFLANPPASASSGEIAPSAPLVSSAPPATLAAKGMLQEASTRDR